MVGHVSHGFLEGVWSCDLVPAVTWYGQVRGKLYELLANCVPPELIMRQLLLELLKKMDDEIKVGGTRGRGGEVSGCVSGCGLCKLQPVPRPLYVTNNRLPRSKAKSFACVTVFARGGGGKIFGCDVAPVSRCRALQSGNEHEVAHLGPSLATGGGGPAGSAFRAAAAGGRQGDIPP